MKVSRRKAGWIKGPQIFDRNVVRVCVDVSIGSIQYNIQHWYAVACTYLLFALHLFQYNKHHFTKLVLKIWDPNTSGRWPFFINNTAQQPSASSAAWTNHDTFVHIKLKAKNNQWGGGKNIDVLCGDRDVMWHRSHGYSTLLWVIMSVSSTCQDLWHVHLSNLQTVVVGAPIFLHSPTTACSQACTMSPTGLDGIWVHSFSALTQSVSIVIWLTLALF